MPPCAPEHAGALVQASHPESPGRRQKTPIWQEVRDKVLTEQGLRGGAMERVEPQATPAEQVFGALDKNQDGVISRAEWNAAMSSPGQAAYSTGMRAMTPSRGTGGAAPMLPIHRQARRATSPESPQPAQTSRTQMQDVRRGLAAQRQEQDLQVAWVQDSVREAEQTRHTIASLAAEKERLQRQAAELAVQHEQHKLQTTEMRATMFDLQSENSRMQQEQRRQAKLLVDAQARQNAVDVTPLKRQVDSVKDVVSSQEQKLARIEENLSQAASRGQLQEVLQQSRHMSRALEEEAARRSQCVSDLQTLIVQERNRDTGMATRLQAELTKATSTMQAQTEDWSHLAKVIKSEVGQLAGEMRADREARALEAASQRYEITRMVEQTRLANVASSVGSYTFGVDGDLGTDMLSEAGAVAVHKMVDTTKALLHGLEEALILRAGFLAGVFHTWRSEGILLKEQRRYERAMSQNEDGFRQDLMRAAECHMNHKEAVKQRLTFMVDKWFTTEAHALKLQCSLCWHRYAAYQKRLKESATSIYKACLEWVEGKDKALKHSTWVEWRTLTKLESTHRAQSKDLSEIEKRHQQELEKAQLEAEAKVAEGLATIQQHSHRARQDLDVMVAKWQRKGIAMVALVAWRQWLVLRKAAKKQSLSVQEAVNKFFVGEKMGVLRSICTAWRNNTVHGKQLGAEIKQRRVAACTAVELTLKQWELGAKKGLKKESMEVWARLAKDARMAKKRLETVQSQVHKLLGCQITGMKQSCFLTWRNARLDSAADKKVQDFLADKKKAHETELDTLRSKMKQSLRDVVMAQWKWGEKGLVDMALFFWSAITKDIKGAARKRNAVHDAMTKFMVGKDKAAKLMVWLHWKQTTQETKMERGEADRIQAARNRWEERENEFNALQEKAAKTAQSREAQLLADASAAAHTATNLMLRLWMGGDENGLLGKVFNDWRRVQALQKEVKTKREAVKDSLNRFILGERMGIVRTMFNTWVNQHKLDSESNGTIAKLQKQVEQLLQRHQEHQRKFAVMMVKSDGPVLKGMVFGAWREASQGIKVVELEREREVELAALRREMEIKASRRKESIAKAASGLGSKEDRVLLVEVFLAWKLHWQLVSQEQAEKLKHNHAMKEFATRNIMKQYQKDSAALLAASFMEWHRVGRHVKFEEAHNLLPDKLVYIQQLEQLTSQLQDQLSMASSHIALITETLQKEYRTNEELTRELRDSFDKMRQGFSPYTPTTHAPGDSVGASAFCMTSRPSSAQSRSGQSTGRLDHSRRLAQARGEGPADSVFDMLDRNQDGAISRAEWIAAMQGSTSGALSGSSRPGSPSRCDWDEVRKLKWDEVIKKLKAERRLLGKDNVGAATGTFSSP